MVRIVNVDFGVSWRSLIEGVKVNDQVKRKGRYLELIDENFTKSGEMRNHLSRPDHSRYLVC